MNETESTSVHPATLPTRQGLHGGSPLPPHAMQACHRPLPQNLATPTKKQAANALAAAHPNRPHHLIRHACSARFLMSAVSLLARALASSVMNPVVSRENLPPTSTARTTNRALHLAPRNSKQLCSLRFLAAMSATPSRSEAPLLGLPSPCKTLSRVVCTASWAPCNGRGDRRPRPPICERPPVLLWEGPCPAQKHLCGLGHLPLCRFWQLHQCKTSTTEHPGAGTCCAMMAIGVDETATSANTAREGVVGEVFGGGSHGTNTTVPWSPAQLGELSRQHQHQASLRPHQGPHLI